MKSARVDRLVYASRNDGSLLRSSVTLSVRNALTLIFLPSAAVATHDTRGVATPGLVGMVAGVDTTVPRAGSSRFISAMNELYAEMPASDDVVAPSSYLPKIATTLSWLSSQILLYSGNFPVVLIGLVVTVARAR